MTKGDHIECLVESQLEKTNKAAKHFQFKLVVLLVDPEHTTVQYMARTDGRLIRMAQSKLYHIIHLSPAWCK